MRSAIRDTAYAIALENALRAERGRLVRWCAYLTGSADAAEDLVQDTCAVAWRSARRPDHVGEYPAWLAGIARNICLSWKRRQQREAAHHARLVFSQAPDDQPAPMGRRNEELAHPFDSFDPAALLEKDELAQLLDRALGLLPVETRKALILKYIEDVPLAEGAARLGISESALAARLHRGKASLRRLLTTELRADATLYGLAAPTDDGWRETRIWCPECAAYRLTGKLMQDRDTFALRCPQCFARRPVDFARWFEPGLFAGLSSHRAALTRLAHSAYGFYQQALRHGAVSCKRCGGRAHASREHPDALAENSHDPVCVQVYCPTCRITAMTTLSGLLLCHAQTQRFWRSHPRMLALPHHHIEYHGQPAILTTFVSRDGIGRLELISDRDTLESLTIIGA